MRSLNVLSPILTPHGIPRHQPGILRYIQLKKWFTYYYSTNVLYFEIRLGKSFSDIQYDVGQSQKEQERLPKPGKNKYR